MQKTVIIIVSLIVGLIIGSWIPRSELRIMKKDIEKLRKDYNDCQQSKSEPSLMKNVTSILGVSGAQSPPPSREHSMDRKNNIHMHKENDKKSDISDVEPDGLPPEDSHGDDRIDDQDHITGQRPDRSKRDFQAELETARDLWRSRSSQARELLREDLALNDEEIRGFDNVVSSMNNRLEEEIASLASSVQYKDQMSTEDGLRIANGITGILLDTYSELDTVLPSDWRDNTTKETDIINFIDPMVAAPLAQIYGPSDKNDQRDTND